MTGRYVVVDEHDAPVVAFDVAFDAVMCRRTNEPAVDAWGILDTATGDVHR
ncbi:hypothetical protein [Microbacterium soli]|uniref:Uncharacterized protein n=1 Tax=Microbacterium soli TaxID=446075 RepID=A0ABP7NK66_9MICO